MRSTAEPASSDASRSIGGCGTVLVVPLDDLPDWLPDWCLDHLGSGPAGVLFQIHQVSMVFGLRLAGGSEVVVKARADDGRAVSCVAAQARLAERGFPCARPLARGEGDDTTGHRCDPGLGRTSRGGLRHAKRMLQAA